MRAQVAAAALTAIVLYGSGLSPAVTDVDGRQVRPAEGETAVLVFVRTDCPVSNRYAPELARMQQRFPGAAFTLVYVDPTQSLDEIRRHVRAYDHGFAAVHDPDHELVKHTGARITPEVAVFRRGSLVYRGRIDDRYVEPGRTRPAASTHDLEDVLTALAEGKPVRFRSTKAVGCFIEDVR